MRQVLKHRSTGQTPTSNSNTVGVIVVVPGDDDDDDNDDKMEKAGQSPRDTALQERRQLSSVNNSCNDSDDENDVWKGISSDGVRGIFRPRTTVTPVKKLRKQQTSMGSQMDYRRNNNNTDSIFRLRQRPIVPRSNNNNNIRNSEVPTKNDDYDLLVLRRARQVFDHDHVLESESDPMWSATTTTTTTTTPIKRPGTVQDKENAPPLQQQAPHLVDDWDLLAQDCMVLPICVQYDSSAPVS